MPIEVIRINSVINKSLPFRGNETLKANQPAEENHMSESTKLLIGAGSVAAIAIATIAIIKSKNKKNGDIVDKTLNKGKEEADKAIDKTTEEVKNVFKGFKDKLVELLEKTPPVFKKGKKATIEYQSGVKRVDSFLHGERVSEYFAADGKLVRRVEWNNENKIANYQVFGKKNDHEDRITRQYYNKFDETSPITYVNKYKDNKLVQVRQSNGIIKDIQYDGDLVTSVKSTKEGKPFEVFTWEYNNNESPIKYIKKDADGNIIVTKEAVYSKGGKKPVSITITRKGSEPVTYLFKYPKKNPDAVVIIDKATNSPIVDMKSIEADLDWSFL